MTRFGRWFAGAVALLVALFVAGLMMPGRRAPLATEPAAAPVTAEPGVPIATNAASPTGLTIPVANIPAYALTDTFGDPRGVDGERGHGALDIMAPRGTAVVAAAAGTIEKIFESELGGHTIYVRSPDRRFIYYYAHLDSYAPAVREGVYVAQGERIGTVGSTGDADPAAPHLHFEIKRMGAGQPWHEGAAINPYPLLAGRAGGA